MVVRVSNREVTRIKVDGEVEGIELCELGHGYNFERVHAA